MQIIKTLLAFWLIVLLGITTVPQTAQAADKMQLSDYIGKRCRTGCVNPRELIKAVTKASNTLGLNLKVILAIVRIESGFVVKARNGRSNGLMQVHLKYHTKKFKSNDYLNVEDNVYVGASIFKECLDMKKGNLDRALICYNAGAYSRSTSMVYPNKIKAAMREMASLDLQELDDPMQGLIELLNLGISPDNPKEELNEVSLVPAAAPVEVTETAQFQSYYVDP